MRYIKRFILLLLILLLVLVGLVIITLYSPSVQTFVAKKAATYYLGKLDNRIEFDDLYIDLSKEVRLEGVYVEDLNKDTLILAPQIYVPIRELSLWNQKVHIGDISIHKPIVNITKKEGKEKYNIEDILESLGIDLAPKEKKEEKDPPTWDIKIGDIVATKADIHFEDQDIKVIVDGTVQKAMFNIETNIVNVDTLHAIGTEGKSDVYFDATIPKGNLNVQTLIAHGERVSAEVDVRKHYVEVDATLEEGQINLKNFDVQGNGGVAEVRLPNLQATANGTIASATGNVKTLIFDANDLAAIVELEKQKLTVDAQVKEVWINADTLLVEGKNIIAKVDDQKGRVKIDGGMDGIKGALKPLTFVGTNVAALVELPKQNIIVDAQTPTLIADAKKLLFEAEDWEADVKLTKLGATAKANAPTIYADVNNLLFTSKDLEALVALEKQEITVDASLSNVEVDMKQEMIDGNGLKALVALEKQEITVDASLSNVEFDIKQQLVDGNSVEALIKMQKEGITVDASLSNVEFDIKQQLLDGNSIEALVKLQKEELTIDASLANMQVDIINQILNSEGVEAQVNAQKQQIKGTVATNELLIDLQNFNFQTAALNVDLFDDKNKLAINSQLEAFQADLKQLDISNRKLELDRLVMAGPALFLKNPSSQVGLFVNWEQLVLEGVQTNDWQQQELIVPQLTIVEPYIAAGPITNTSIPSNIDTLFYTPQIQLNQANINLAQNRYVINELISTPPKVRLKRDRKSQKYNYEQITQLFTNPSVPPSLHPSVPPSPYISLQHIQLPQPDVQIHDEVTAKKLFITSSMIDLHFQEMDAANLLFDLQENTLQNIYIALEEERNSQAKDTLLFIKDIALAPIRLSLKEPTIVKAQDIILQDPYVKITKKASLNTQEEPTFNLEQVLAMFSTPTSNQMDGSVPVSILTGGSSHLAPRTSHDNILLANSLQLLRPRFRLDDASNQLQVNVQLNQLATGIEKIGLGAKDIALDQILLDQLAVQVKSNKVDDGIEEEHNEEWYNEILPLTPKDWMVKANHLVAENGLVTLQTNSKNTPPPGSINFANMQVSHIKADLANIAFGHDQISGQVNHLSAKEWSGFQVDHLAGKVFVSPTNASIENLKLQTPYSQLGDYIALEYPSFRAFSDFVQRVKIEANFANNSFLQFDDLFFFAPQLKEVELIKSNASRSIALEGRVSGKVNKIRGRDLKIQVGDIAYQGDLKMTGLPDFYNTHIRFKVEDLQTDLVSIRELIPDVNIPANFDKLGKLSFTGKFLGYPHEFVADGILKTDLGDIQSDIIMSLKKGETPTYEGNIKLVDFNLYKWMNNNDQFDKLSLDASLKGKGLTINDLDVELEKAHIAVDFKGYSYDSIMVKSGYVKGKLFDGQVEVQDQNANFGFQGTVDLSNEVPAYKLNYLIVRHLDLAPLNIVPTGKYYSDLQLKGVAFLDMKGDDIDNFEGIARFRDFTVSKDTISTLLRSVDFSSFFEEDKRAASLKFDYGTADFYGDFDYRELIPSVQNYLHTYFPYRFDSAGETSEQDIDFNIQIKDPIPLTKLFVPGLEKLDSLGVSGNFNTLTKEMSLEGDVPEFLFDGNRGERLVIVASSDEESIAFAAQIDSVITSGAVDIPRIFLDGEVYNDSIEFKLAVAPDEANTRFTIEGLLFANLDRLKMNFTNTEIVINDKAWEASTGSFMYKNQDIFAIENIILSQGKQKISLKSDPSDVFNNETVIEVENVLVNDFKELDVIENLGLAGTLNGRVYLKDIFQQQLIESTFSIENLHFLKQAIGDVTAAVSKKKEDPNVNIQADLFGDLYKGEGRGTYTLPPEGEKDGVLDIDLDLEKASMLFLEPFIGEFTSDLAGTGAVNLNLHGKTSAPKLSGDITMNDVQVTVDYLQTTYRTRDEAKVEVDNNMLNFSNLIILDKDTNTAVLNGFFDLGNFKEMYLDVDMRSDEFLFLDTDITDNDLFYGTAYGDGGARIYGNLSEINMDIQGRSLPQTAIYILLEEGASDIGDDRIYSFIVRDTSLLASQLDTVSSVGFDINMDLDITEDALIQIIFDLNAGDIIESRGKGNLQMQVNTIGDFDFNMYGIYEILEGEYLFSIQKVINKFFTVKPGGRITFTGDPYQAQLDLSAIYGLRTSRYDIFNEADRSVLTLGSQTSNAEDIARKRTPIDVYLNMSGVLAQPDIKFDIRQRESTLPMVDNLFATRISELTNADQNELNKQIFGLLILNRFMPLDEFGIDLRSGVNTTLSEFLSSYLLSYFNDAVSDLIKGAEINFSWNQYDADYIEFDDQLYPNTRSEIGLSYTQRMFEDRISVNIGGNVDVGRQFQSYDNVAIAGDFIVIYDITKDGVYQLKAFNKFDKDLFDGDYNKIGVSFLASQEFDKFGELFKRKNAKKTKAERKQARRERWRQ